MEVSISKKGTPYVKARLLTPQNCKWYIEYQWFDPERDRLVVKRYFRIPGETEEERRTAGEELVAEFNAYLFEGFTASKKYNRNNRKSTPRLTALKAFDKVSKIKIQGVGPRSQQNYRNYYGIFRAWLVEQAYSRKPIQLLDRNQLSEFFIYLFEERNNGNRTRNNYLEFIRSLMEMMIELEMIKKNPLKGMKKWRVESPKNIPFLEAEKNRLENYLRKSHLQLFYFTRFIYYGFMRPVEICRMKVNHIDLQRRLILVRIGTAKNSKQMPVVIPTSLVPIIKEMKLHLYPGSHHVFSKDLLPGPKELWRNRVSEMHADALKATDLYNGELALYSWKHTGNVNAYLAGVDIKSIQSQNRHSSLEMTEIYLRSLGLRISRDLKEKVW